MGEEEEAQDYHINKQSTTNRKKYRLQNSATYRPPIKIKQINYQPEIFGPWALGPKGCTNQHHHHQQVAGNNNHEYPRRSHLTDISLANSWRRDVKKTYNIFTTIISPPYKLPTLMDLI